MSTAGPAHRVQSAVEAYGFPNGHLGHLTPEEEAAFKNFKALCEENGYYKPGSGEDEPGTHDDATLLRYLRARRFVVQEAWKQFKDTEDWRKANEIDTLYETIDLNHYEETRRLYPQWTGRRDKRGIPVYVFEVKHLNSKTMAAYEKSAIKTHSQAKTDGKIPGKLLRLFALYENLTRFVMPLCTALTDREYPRTPITQSNNIVDISGVGLKQFWNLRGHMQDASTLATAHYPETLDRIFIIGAPAFFPTVWGWIKKWFDPITTSKIFILGSHDMKKTLESFIDPENIPKKYGGKLEFLFGDMPSLDPALKEVIAWKGDRKDFSHGPMYWVNKDNDSEIEAIAVGTVDGNQRSEPVCTIKKSNEAYDGMNGHATAGSQIRPELLSVPTQPPSINEETTKAEVPTVAAPSASVTEENAVVSAPVETTVVPVAKQETLQPPTAEAPGAEIQEGKVVPTTRPEPTSFHTAHEDLNTLSPNEKAGHMPNGTTPHVTAIANKLDPAMDQNGEARLQDAPVHHEAEDGVAAVNSAAESPDHALGKKAEGESLLSKVRGTVGL